MKTIAEKNRMIAEFMGYETYDHTDSTAIRLKEGNEFNSEDIGHIHTKFHTSWDWLMPVLKKISGVLFSEFASSVTEQWRMIESPTKYDIKNVHEQAYQFIEWYNENK